MEGNLKVNFSFLVGEKKITASGIFIEDIFRIGNKYKVHELSNIFQLKVISIVKKNKNGRGDNKIQIDGLGKDFIKTAIVIITSTNGEVRRLTEENDNIIDSYRITGIKKISRQ